MLLGQYRLFLDKDHSLAIPEPLRGLFADGAYVTRGFEKNLLILSDRFFRNIYQQLASINTADPSARLLRRLLLGNAARLEISQSGQILLPQDLLSFADLEKDLLLVGQGDYLEAWAPPQWEKQISILMETEANAERFAHLVLALQ